MTKKKQPEAKPNVTPEDIGNLYQDVSNPTNDNIYRLISFQPAPTAVFQNVKTLTELELFGSEYAPMARLLLEHPIAKPPAPRKTRSDKGKPRERKPKTEQIELFDSEIVITPELEEMEEGLNSEGLTLLKPTRKKAKGKPDISTFSCVVGLDDQPNILRLGEVVINSATLIEGVKELLSACGIDQKYIEDAPESEGKRNLLDILKEGGK